MFLLIAFFAAVARAVPVTFCIAYNVDIEDAEGIGDDFINDNAANVPARGAWMRVKETTSGTPVWTGHLNEGTNPGCTPGTIGLTHNLAGGYTIVIKSESVIRGNNLYLYDTDAGGGTEYGASPSTTYNPPLGGETKTFVLAAQTWWSNMAIASWALYHENTGAMEDITIYMDGCGTGVDGTCCANDVSGHYVYADGHARKGLLTHFLGHCVWTASTGPDFSDDTHLYDANIGPCDYDGGFPHNLLTREYQASNVWEGWAHFYQANAFNDGLQWDWDDECWIYYYNAPLDWNADGAADDAGEDDAIVSCAGSTNVEDDADYYDDFCAGDPTPLDGIDDDANMGTELDWMRFFWDWAWEGASGTTLGADDTLALVLAANPAGWNTSGHATGAGNPYEDVGAAAIAGPSSWYMTWGTIDGYNGIER
jgi:hypothetical protein